MVYLVLVVVRPFRPLLVVPVPSRPYPYQSMRSMRLRRRRLSACASSMHSRKRSSRAAATACIWTSMLPDCCNLINKLPFNKNHLQDFHEKSASIRRDSRPPRQDMEGISAADVEATTPSKATAGVIPIMA